MAKPFSNVLQLESPKPLRFIGSISSHGDFVTCLPDTALLADRRIHQGIEPTLWKMVAEIAPVESPSYY